MRIADGIYLAASGDLGVSLTHPLDCNAYLLRCGDSYVFIDSGVGLEPERIEGVVKADGIPLSQVTHLLLTHYHLDHAGGAAAFRRELGLEVWAGPITAPVLEAGDEEAISLAPAKRAGIYPPGISFSSCPVDRVIQPGDCFCIGDSEFTPIQAPGHSRDMLCYLVRQPQRTILIAGDVVFHGGRISLQITWDCDIHAYADTIHRLATLEFDVMLPGHGLWSLANGSRHIRSALSTVQRLLLPVNL